MRRLVISASLATVLFGVCLEAQDRSSPPAQPTFRTATDVVVLDAVMRDRRGRIVSDLEPDDVMVLEDGVRQPINQFRFVESGVPVETGGAAPLARAAQVPARGAEPGTVQKLRHPNLVTLVFDQLGPQARTLARKAALDFLELQDRPDVFVSVFQIGHTLRLAQQFTSDRERLRAVITQVTGEADTQYVAGTDDISSAVAAADQARQRLEAAAAIDVGGGEGAATVAGLAREAAMADFVVNALRMTQTLQREQQGTASLYALLALAKKQQVLSGRKTVLFFSEGLQTPPNLEHVLKTAISEANRANVSIYAVDARGLLTDSDMHESRDMLQDAVRTSQRQNMSGGGRPVTREEVMISDTAESAIRMNTQASLAELAESTGGVLIGNSNDLRKGIARAVGDLSGYYEIAYSPTNRTFDGSFRRITLDVKRAGVTVQARSGYFALPPGEAAIDFPFELDLLKVLRAEAAAKKLPLRTRMFQFGYEGTRRRFTLVVDVPLEVIRIGPAPGGQQQAHFSFLSLIRDGAGSVAEKFSEDTPVLVPKDQVDALKQGSAVFIRSFTLPAGEYVLETAVLDQQSKLSGVEQTPMTVAPATGLTMSTPAFIKRTETIAPGALASPDPFRVGDLRFVPYVTVPAVTTGDLSLFVMVYPSAGQPAPEMVLEFSRDGTLSGRSTPALPAPDAQGRISFLAPIPVSRFSPGQYDVRVIVQQGTQSLDEQLTFTVLPGPGGSAR